MTKKKKNSLPLWVWAVLAAGASGALMAVCFWPLHWHFAAWVALVPILIVLPKVKPDRAMLFGALLALVFYRIALDWLFDLAGPIGVAVVIAFSVLMGFGFYVARLLIERFGITALLWAPPMCLLGQELLRSESLPHFRFSYTGWGYSQAPNLWLAQIASIGGVYLITFLIVAFNSALAYGVIKKRPANWIPAGVIALFILILGFIAQPPSYESLPEVPVACVQVESYYYQDHQNLTDQALNDPLQPKFIVFPEHAIFDFADENHSLVKQLSQLAQKHQAYICIGAKVRAIPGAKYDFDNVAMTIGPTGQIINQQAKSIPIPFFTDDGNPAQEQHVIETPYGTIGSYVCYDGGFTDVPRRLADKGAQLLLGPVMNPADWPEAQRYQQADVAIFRSIELRRCAVRAASSGISQIIDATGRVLAQRIQAEDMGVLLGNVYFVDEKTFFVRFGYVFSHIVGWLFLISTAILVPADRIRYWSSRRRRKKQTSP
ncbi:apolipoprotein N-acyltransferase [Planctomycetota bacterium]